MDRYLLGIDIGTSGLKAGVVDRDGVVCAHLSAKTPASFGRAGQAKQDADHLVKMTLDIVPQVCERAGITPAQIEAIGIDGQMGGVIGVDRRFSPITGLDMGLDLAAEEINADAHDRFRSRLLAVSCGSPRNTPKIVWWKENHPEVYRRVRRFTTIGPYVAGVLTGISGDAAFIDPTLIAYFGNEDARRQEWSLELTELWGLDIEKMPVIRSPWEVVGGIDAEIARAGGLREGVPVVAGAGDQPAGFFGGAFENPGTTIDIGGSTTMLAMCVEEFRPDPGGRIMYIPGVSNHRYYAIWYINGAGLVIPWFEQQILGNDSDGSSTERSLEALSHAASTLPIGSDDLLFSPYFGGRQNPYNRTLRGGWIGLNWGHTTAHMLRAMYEGIASQYRGGLESMVRGFPHHDPPSVYAIGGATESKLLMEITANTIQKPLLVREGYEASIRGSALLGGVGIGWYDLSTVPKYRGKDFSYRFDPDSTAKIAVDKLYAAYNALFEQPLEETFRYMAAQLHQ
jgi:xylulokinase